MARKVQVCTKTAVRFLKLELRSIAQSRIRRLGRDTQRSGGLLLGHVAGLVPVQERYQSLQTGTDVLRGQRFEYTQVLPDAATRRDGLGPRPSPWKAITRSSDHPALPLRSEVVLAVSTLAHPVILDLDLTNGRRCRSRPLVRRAKRSIKSTCAFPRLPERTDPPNRVSSLRVHNVPSRQHPPDRPPTTSVPSQDHPCAFLTGSETQEGTMAEATTTAQPSGSPAAAHAVNRLSYGSMRRDRLPTLQEVLTRKTRPPVDL